MTDSPQAQPPKSIWLGRLSTKSNCWSVTTPRSEGAVEFVPRVETGLSVEAALKELLEMFPDEHNPAIGKFISVKRQDFIDSNHLEVSQTVHIYIGYGQSPPSCSAGTLDEAMDQARAWAKSRAEKESDGSK